MSAPNSAGLPFGALEFPWLAPDPTLEDVAAMLGIDLGPIKLPLPEELLNAPFPVGEDGATSDSAVRNGSVTTTLPEQMIEARLPGDEGTTEPQGGAMVTMMPEQMMLPLVTADPVAPQQQGGPMVTMMPDQMMLALVTADPVEPQQLGGPMVTMMPDQMMPTVTFAGTENHTHEHEDGRGHDLNGDGLINIDELDQAPSARVAGEAGGSSASATGSSSTGSPSGGVPGTDAASMVSLMISMGTVAFAEAYPGTARSFGLPSGTDNGVAPSTGSSGNAAWQDSDDSPQGTSSAATGNGSGSVSASGNAAGFGSASSANGSGSAASSANGSGSSASSANGSGSSASNSGSGNGTPTGTSTATSAGSIAEMISMGTAAFAQKYFGNSSSAGNVAPPAGSGSGSSNDTDDDASTPPPSTGGSNSGTGGNASTPSSSAGGSNSGTGGNASTPSSSTGGSNSGTGNSAVVDSALPGWLQGVIGPDRFVFATIADSPLDRPDFIGGFETGVDKIDLTALGVDASDVTISAFGAAGADITININDVPGADMKIVVLGNVQMGDLLF